MKLSILLVAALIIGAISVAGCASSTQQQPLIIPINNTTVNATPTANVTTSVVTVTPTPVPTATPVPTPTPTATPTPIPPAPEPTLTTTTTSVSATPTNPTSGEAVTVTFGVFTQGGKPIPSATVAISLGGVPLGQATTSTSGYGTFTFTETVPVGEWRVGVSYPGSIEYGASAGYYYIAYIR